MTELTNKPIVSVIIVTLNGSELLRNCLKSLAMQDYPCYEVVVVDNGSSEDIAALVRAESQDAIYIRSDVNKGFAGGNNIGIRAANGKYVALINNDATASPDWLTELVRVAESDDKISAVASLVIDGNKPTVLDSCGVSISLDGMSRQVRRGEAVPRMEEASDILAVSGCACLIRKSALDDVGLFDERFFAYCEDTDLSLRLLRAGGKIKIAPAARVTHLYSQTGGPFSLKKIFWVERNHFWVALKNFPLRLLLFLPLVTVWRHCIQFYAMLSGVNEIQSFVKGSGFFAVLTTIMAAHTSALVLTPIIFFSRFRRSQRRLSGNELTRLILKHRISLAEVIMGRSKHAGNRL